MHGGNRTRFFRSALIGALAMGTSGCAGIERFAPPGIVKYEDLAQGRPMNEGIEARVAEGKGASSAAFPNLSQSPQEAPETLAPETQAELEATLKGTRSALQTVVVADRQAARPGVNGAEAQTLEEARDALKALVAEDDVKARRERGLPPRKLPQ